MAYITTEQVKEIRNNIKKAFPAKSGFKFSVTKENYSKVNVAIMKAPKEYGFKGYELVNHYYIEDHYTGEAKELLTTLNDILHKDHYDNSDAQIDYFDCAFYVSIQIGKWNKDCNA